jgi:hypothetical protein
MELFGKRSVVPHAVPITVALRAAFALVLLVLVQGCGSSLAQPFDRLENAPMTIYRLQNFEPPPQPTAAAPAVPAIPPQIQQWLQAGAAMLPPGLLPPGLLPGTAAPPPQQDPNVQRFHGFRILSWQQITDTKTRKDVLEIFGKEKNFEPARESCVFAEFGVSIAQQNAPPANILVSLSCNQVQAFNFNWPYNKTGLKPDTTQKFVEVVQRVFGR